MSILDYINFKDHKFNIFLALYTLLTFTNLSHYMQAILTREFDKKTDKYVYNISNISYLPLSLALKFSFWIFCYILLVYILNVITEGENDHIISFEDCIHVVSVTLFASVIMFGSYFYIEKTSKLSNLWNSYRHESANGRSFTFILIFNLIFMSVLFSALLKIESLTSLFKPETVKQTKQNEFVLLILGLTLVLILNFIYPYKHSDSKVLVHQISYTIAFISVLIFG